MNEDNDSSIFIVEGSPIDFVLVGPKKSRIGVIARSNNHRLDLIGLANGYTLSGSTIERDQPKLDTSRILSNILGFVYTEQMHSVRSIPIDDPMNLSDDRGVSFGFAWVGHCSEDDQVVIYHIFNSRIDDIYRGVIDNSIESIEWGISPIIYHCTRASRSARRQEILRSIYWIIYLLVAVVTIIVGMGQVLQLLRMSGRLP